MLILSTASSCFACVVQRLISSNVLFAGGFLAGLGAGVTEAILIVTPFEVVKTRLQVQKGFDASTLKYHGPIDCAKKIVKEEGATVRYEMQSFIVTSILFHLFQQATNKYFVVVMIRHYGRESHQRWSDRDGTSCFCSVPMI